MCVCVCVCLLPSILPLGATRQPRSYANRLGIYLYRLSASSSEKPRLRSPANQLPTRASVRCNASSRACVLVCRGFFTSVLFILLVNNISHCVVLHSSRIKLSIWHIKLFLNSLFGLHNTVKSCAQSCTPQVLGNQYRIGLTNGQFHQHSHHK